MKAPRWFNWLADTVFYIAFVVYCVALALFLPLLLSGCGGQSARGPLFGEKEPVTAARCPKYGPMDRYAELWGMLPKYNVTPSILTPQGISIDPSGHEVDPIKVDNLVYDIDQCMYEQFGEDGKITIPADVQLGAWCYTRTPKYPVDKTCITIKVDMAGVGCSGDQMLRWEAPDNPDKPDESCRGKGRIPTKECPCRWRSGMQDGHTIVTTPDFKLFADWYIRLFYGCRNPWGHPDVAKCAGLRL